MTCDSSKVSWELRNWFKIFSLCYLIVLENNTNNGEIIDLIDFEIEVHSINSIYTAKLDF